MDTPKLDSRDRWDILEELRKLAASYVPEWRWDERQPDAGAVLAHIYAQLTENTISKYNRSMYNHYLSFLNLLGTRLMPPSPAEGMVSVGVIPGSGGVHIPQGTEVYAAAETETGRVFYETTQAVCALDTEVDRVFFTSAQRDSIVCAYDRSRDKNRPIRLFDFGAYPELQSHILYFREDELFYTRDRLDLTVEAAHDRSAKQRRHTMELLADPGSAVWEYHSTDGWQAVEQVAATAQGIRLIGHKGSVPVEEGDGEKRGLLRCRLRRVPPGGVCLTGVSWTGQGADLAADALSCNVTELPGKNFSPFGDVLSIFTDFNLSSREVFTKSGARIELDFELDFFKTPIERPPEPDSTQYRNFMTEEDFVTVREQDVVIERVLWEYWNGLGWARLFPAGENEDLFTPREQAERRRKLTFICPPDMADVAVGAAEGPFLRARIDKLSGMAARAGHYIVPFVRQLGMSYHYETPVQSREILVESNLETCLRPLPDPGVEPLVTAGLCPAPAMYLCLTGPLSDGPVRVFWDVEEGLHPDPIPLLWEYYGRTSSGAPGWKNIEVMDLTRNGIQSAVVTLVGKKDFVRARLFGAEGYFVRLVDTGRRYDGADPRKCPVIRGIWPNTVPVIQRERRAPEYFYVARGEGGKRCALSAANVSQVEVWVNEQGALSVKEEEALLQDPRVEVERSLEGTVTGIWVPWGEIDRLESAGPEDRVFAMEYARDTVCFGDGRHGRIPPDRADESIRISCCTCDGALGNIEPNRILGFLNKPAQAAWVTNRKRIGGGSDRETIDQAAARTAGELAGMGRVVTLEDFQRCALRANRGIFRVKCAAHMDRFGHQARGALAVAVLPREYREGSELFSCLARDVRRELKDKASLLLSEDTRLDVFEVRYVELCVAAEVVIHDYNQYHEVHQAISRRLREFLDPITGGFNGRGWEIGRLPGRELVYNCVKTVKHIRWIKGLHIFPYMVTENGRQAVELEQARRDSFAVPVFGEPELTLSVE